MVINYLHNMKTTLKWISLSIIFFLCSCTQVEKKADSSLVKSGVYAYIPSIICDDANATKAVTDPADMQLSFDMSDRINIWSEAGTLLIYEVQSLLDGGGAIFDGGGYDLTEGETYYSTFPLIANVRDDFKALSTSFEGQVQVADGDASHIPDYTFLYTSGVCKDGWTSFRYHYINRWIKFELTLPAGTVVTGLDLVADSEVFALDGTVDAMTGEFTPVTMTNTMTLGFDDVEVKDGVLNAYLALSTYAACNVVVTVYSADGKTYTSESIPQADASAAGMYRVISTSLSDVNNTLWEKVTENSQLTTGDFVIVYPTADCYKVFSFYKSFVNATQAAESVKDMHTIGEVFALRTELFQTIIGGNYEAVDVPADPMFLEIPADVVDYVAINATTQPGEDSNGTAMLATPVLDFRFTNVFVALGTDGVATITAQPDATDLTSVLTALRGNEIKLTFADFINFCADEAGVSDNARKAAISAFDKLSLAAKNVLQEHGFGTLMDIDHTTRIMDVFKIYYNQYADLSLAFNEEKAISWLKPVGFYVENDGFSAHVPTPSPVWFEYLAESLDYGAGTRESFIKYWKGFDAEHPEYAAVFSRTTFFGRIAEKFYEYGITDEEFDELLGVDWISVGKKYERYVNDLNKDNLVDVYIYKRVE